MPQQTDLVVKNGSDVDKTFKAITPAAGDGGIALWALKEGPISAVFPTFTASARQNGNQVRALTLRMKVPSSYTDTVTGLTNVASQAEVNVSVKMPATFPEASKGDFVAFTVNLLASELVKEMIRDATGAT